MSQNQTSGEDTGENQMSDEETGENQNSDEEIGQSSDEEFLEEGRRCILSDPAQPHNISRLAGDKTKQNCISCGRRNISWEPRHSNSFHYFCTVCQVEFHRECHKTPSKMIHPYHPQHPLTFTFLHKRSEAIVDTNFGEHYNFLFNYMSIGFQKTFETIPSSSTMFDKCTWCGNDLGEWFYRCLICNFSLDLQCTIHIPPFKLQNPKNHHHSLSLFPRPLSFPCNACGLIDVSEPGYACYLCNYVVHRYCDLLPRVIKITRHPHRLSYAPYLPTKVSSCRICYKNVDIKYGQYSCNHEDCSFVAHSKCATDREVWDSEELEWEPEDPEETEEDIAPFKRVGDGLIEHFCHQHHYLKLEKYNGIRDSRKQCQVCMRHITSHDFYDCIECDFFLHEVCANLPRKLDHALHKHSLFMDPYPLYHSDYYDLSCKVCDRDSSGWKYRCKKDGCAIVGPQFQVDINCILVPECFTHESHPEHLLFVSGGGAYRGYGEILCQGCKKTIYGYRLHCTICEFVICYECATIPDEICYKYDEHPLSLCYGESGVDDMYWCEVCEKRLDPMEWFYTNNERCTTIHQKCLFGDSAYMKPGHTFDYDDKKVQVVGNGSSSRPVCHTCLQRSPQPVYFKVYKRGTEFIFCSINCFSRSSYSVTRI